MNVSESRFEFFFNANHIFSTFEKRFNWHRCSKSIEPMCGWSQAYGCVCDMKLIAFVVHSKRRTTKKTRIERRRWSGVELKRFRWNHRKCRNNFVVGAAIKIVLYRRRFNVLFVDCANVIRLKILWFSNLRRLKDVPSKSECQQSKFRKLNFGVTQITSFYWIFIWN